jgi:uncharacterized protein (TIGR03000 family)
MAVPAAPAAPATPMKTGAANAPATIQVSLPADARLSIDGYQTTSTSASRVFTSPELPTGRDYQYTLRAEIVRDGQTLTATERVTIRGGATTRVELPNTKFAAASVASR